MLAVSNVPVFSSNEVTGVSAMKPSGDGLYRCESIPLVLHSLMCHRQSGESKEFAKRAIESLIKKLKEKREDLDSLITAITTNGAHPSKCVTIQRTLDGRMQIAGRKCLPHIIYAKIWRWPDLHRNELRHYKFCSYGFELKQDSVCVNPYHYERVASSVDLGSLSLSPSDELEAHELGADSSGCESYPADITDSNFNDQNSQLGSSSNLSLSSTDVIDRVSSSSKVQRSHRLNSRISNMGSDQMTVTNNPSTPIIRKRSVHQGRNFVRTPSLSKISDSASNPDRVNPAPYLDRGQSTMAWCGIGVPESCSPSYWNGSVGSTNSTHIICDGLSSSSSEQQNGVRACVPSPWNGLTAAPQNSRNGPSLSHPLEPTKCGDVTFLCNEPPFVNDNPSKHSGGGTTAGGGNGGSGSGGNGGSGSCSNNNRSVSGSNFGGGSSCPSGGPSGWNQRGGPPQPPFPPSGSLLQPVPVLTTQRPPEFWCNIAYFELDQQVGELFKVPSHYSRVTVDGYTDPSSPNRFCLGQLSNVHRSDQSEKSRLYIGKGVELDNVGEGDVWIRCLSEFSVFVQSYYLDREAGRRPGDAVHKIYPGAYIKVFDIRQCHEQMKLLAHSAQLAAEHQAAVVVGSLPSPTTSGPTSVSQLLPPGPQTGASLSGNQSIPNAPAISPMGTADVGVDDLRRLCMLRLSFVKGWGPDYPRRSIKETPCWIEIQLHRPLQLLDEVLQGMPLNDRKPTRHFFPYFTQPTSGCTVPRPPLPAGRRN